MEIGKLIKKKSRRFRDENIGRTNKNSKCQDFHMRTCYNNFIKAEAGRNDDGRQEVCDMQEVKNGLADKF